MRKTLNIIICSFFVVFPALSEDLVNEFLGDLDKVSNITGAIYAENEDIDPDKVMATLWFDQGQVLTVHAKKVLIRGLKKYPLVQVQDEILENPVSHKYTDYIGDFWFDISAKKRSKWCLSLSQHDYVTITKFLRDEDGEIESSITISARWFDCERIVYQAGIVQAKDREGENFKVYNFPR